MIFSLLFAIIPGILLYYILFPDEDMLEAENLFMGSLVGFMLLILLSAVLATLQILSAAVLVFTLLLLTLVLYKLSQDIELVDDFMDRCHDLFFGQSTQDKES